MNICFQPPADPEYARKVLRLLIQAALPEALARLGELAQGAEE
jgi:hypothetical protein